MISWKYRTQLRILGRRVTVPISQCVHYGAFRYGHDEVHPYESYVVRVQRKKDRAGARAEFIDFLRFYRPTHFAEAIGVDLEARYELWQFPWLSARPAKSWLDDPLECPDIVTHFCPEGILWFRIEQEFFWLERALYSIRRHGYRPEGAIGVIGWRLVRTDGTEAFLIMDGNHRISALAALGFKNVELTYLSSATVHESDVCRWPGVIAGDYSETDARRVLHAYFSGNSRARTTEIAAPLLEMPF